MKKYFVVLLSVMMVLGAFTFAGADDAGMDSVRAAEPGAKVIIGGDAAIRGIWMKNADLSSDDPDDDNRFMDERIRLKIDVDAGDGVAVKSRIILFGDAGSEAVLDGDNTTRDSYNVDYAYIQFPIASVTVDAGLYKRSFGNTLYMIDNRVTTVQVSGELGNAAVSAFLDKEDDTEAGLADNDNLKDHNNWGLTAVTSVNDVEIGAMLYMEKDDRPTTYTNPDDATENGADQSGTELDIFVNANVNDIAIAGEIAYLTGDLNEDSQNNSQMGAFVSATMPVNQVTVSGAICYAKNGFTADPHFTPSLFIGTDQPTAVIDFGATDDEAAYGITATAAYDVSDDLSVYGRLAYLSQAKMGVASGSTFKDRKATEFDAGLAYSLGKNITYNLDFGYLSPDKWDTNADGTEDKDAAMAIAHGISVVF